MSLFRIVFAGLLLSGSAPVSAGTTAYQRAQQLIESDPLEAEALLAAFVQETTNEKLQRAAYYQLFYLRLKNGRLAEAFSQSAAKNFAVRYHEALSETLGIETARARRLVVLLRRACGNNLPVAELGDFLSERRLPAAAYDFSLRVLRKCKVGIRSEIFADGLFDAGHTSRHDTALRLIAIREQLFSDAQKASELLTVVKLENADATAEDGPLGVQIMLLEARIFSEQGQHDAVLEQCSLLPAEKKHARARLSCDFLAAYALLQKGEQAAAYRRIATAKIAPQEIDNRLLRLTVAVAAGQQPPAKLRSFMARASYPYCAASLRALAAQTLHEKTAK